MADTPQQYAAETKQTTSEEAPDVLTSARAAIAADIERRQAKAEEFSKLLTFEQAKEQRDIQANYEALMEQAANALLLESARKNPALSVEVADKIFSQQEKKTKLRLEAVSQQEKFKLQNLQVQHLHYRWQCEMLVALFLIVIGVMLYLPFLGTSSHAELGMALIGAGAAVLTGRPRKSLSAKKDKDDGNTSDSIQ